MAKKAVKKAAKKAAQRSATSSRKKPVKPAIKKKSATAKRQASRPEAESLTHRLEALLHTMRCISQHEDELCTLLHDTRRTGRVSAPLLRDLQSVLSELPAEEYTDDLHAVIDLTDAA